MRDDHGSLFKWEQHRTQQRTFTDGSGGGADREGGREVDHHLRGKIQINGHRVSELKKIRRYKHIVLYLVGILKELLLLQRFPIVVLRTKCRLFAIFVAMPLAPPPLLGRAYKPLEEFRVFAEE